MKTILLLALAFALTNIYGQAASATPASKTPPSSSNVVATLSASAAALTAPLALAEGIISQPTKTELPAGGKAGFEFSLPAAGEYVVRATVNAPNESQNSFYVNIDAPPEDPVMIWDFPVTNGFEERTVSWRGSGDADWSEFNPKIFKLSAGKHQLLLVGREPAQLKSLRIVRWKAPVKGTLGAIQASYEETDSRIELEVRKLPDIPEGTAKANELSKKSRTEHTEQFMAAVQLAREHPQSSTGFAALEWVLQTPRSYYTPAGLPALKLLDEQYATEPTIGQTLATLIRFPPSTNEDRYQPTMALLNHVLAKNSYHTARGYATYGLALVAKEKYEEAEASNNSALQKFAADAEKAFEVLLKEYGECPDLLASATSTQKKTLGHRATNALREIRQLSIGKSAPEIEGEDTEGVRFKLSDYRGKVVLLVFWASWCGPCMQSVPHEKALVEHFKGRPFVLIGVNGDNSLHDATKAVKKNEIPWRSFWNNTKGSGSSIATEWNIRGWPTIYVIDHKGMIREKYCYGPRLDAPLEKLVAAAE